MLRILSRLAWQVVLTLAIFLPLRAPLASASGKELLAIMPLRGEELPPATIALCGELLTARMDESGRFDIITLQDMNAILGMEKLKDAPSCLGI